MRIVSFFRKIISKLSSWRDNAIEWLVKTSFPNFSYKEAKRKIDSLENLKILSYDKDFENRKRLRNHDAVLALLISVFLIFLSLGLIFVTDFESSKLTNLEIFIVPLALVIFLFGIYFLELFINLKLLTLEWIENFIFLILPFEFWLLSSSLWLLTMVIKEGSWVYNSLPLNIFVFIWGILMTSCQVKKVVDYFPNYLYSSIDNRTSYYATPISSIVTLIYGPQIISPENMFQLFTSWGLVLIIGTVVIISMKLKNKSKKNNNIAQKIFEVQLLSNNTDYEELKKCYYHGGEKYKEKLLSNEKFLNIIVESELCSFNDIKNYEDYGLYKAFNYKNYLESQK